MKAILKQVIKRTAVIIKGIFTARPRQKERRLILSIARMKPDDLYTNKIFSVLKGNPDYPYPPIYRRELKMVHRRLVQYQRLRMYASAPEKAVALKKLSKEWNRLQRNHLRKIKGNPPKDGSAWAEKEDGRW